MSRYDEEENWMRISQPESRKRVQNRLSQRRHRAKFRARKNSAAEEDLSLPSASPTFDQGGQVLTDDHLNASVPFARHDDLGSLPMLAQSHDDTDNSTGFDVQHLLPSDYNGPNIPSQEPHPDWSTFSRQFTSQPTTSNRIAPSTSLQNGSGFSTAEVPASCPLPESSPYNYLNGLSSLEPQWTVTGIHHNSTHTENSLSGSSIHPGGNRRPQSRRQPSSRPTTISTSFVEHGAPLRPASRGNEMCQSSHERCRLPPPTKYRYPSSPQSANPYTRRPKSSSHPSSPTSSQDLMQDSSSLQNPYRSTRDFGPASPSITDPVSPLQGANTHCSHCSCIARRGSPLASPKLTLPHNSAPGPTRPTTHTPSSRNLEILSECSEALRNLVHTPDTNSLVDRRRSCSRESSRKSEKGSFAVYSPVSERNSGDEDYDGEKDRSKVVEKVVIVYVNGKLGGSG